MTKISIPDDDKIEEYRSMIHSRHPVLYDVCGTMDGFKVRIDQAPDEITQSRFYNGWKSNHFVTGIFGFVPDGTIAVAFYNVQDVVTIARSLTGEIYTTNWKRCTTGPV